MSLGNEEDNLQTNGECVGAKIGGGGEKLAETRDGSVARLRARQGEIERIVFTNVREAVPDLGSGAGNEYVQGLRTAVAAAVELGLTCLELGKASDRSAVGVTREHRLLERVRVLLAGEPGFAGRPREEGAVDGVDFELGYELDCEHVGVLAGGAGCREALRELAAGLDRRLLCVVRGEETVWGWLGGQRNLGMSDLERAVCAQNTGEDVSFAVGEPARGLQGWRLTHQQAQAAMVVASRRPRRFTRYGEVVLLATALKDELLARALVEAYISPLQDSRNGGPVLCQTLRAYLAAECNLSSAAAALGVVRRTVENRLHTIEERLGRSVHPCPAELEVALALDELGVNGAPEISTVG